MDPIVCLSGVGKSYAVGSGKIRVLNRVSLTVKRGEYLAVLGASGSGKSTLMNIIGCMDTFDEGTYVLDGTDVGMCDDAELTVLRNKKIGFIFQRYHLIPQCTVLQNVLLPLLVQGKSRSEAMDVAQRHIRMVGLGERVSHKPSELSGGQQQRVAIARALVAAPALLLADEPTGALDFATGGEILALFKELNDKGNTIIMITHDMNVAKHSKRIVYLDDGVLTSRQASKEPLCGFCG